MVQPLTADDPREVSGYVLRGRLGAGGMGVVYLSYTRGGQPVALKVVRREYAEDAEFRRRFGREVEAARRVQGAYTTPVLDSDAQGEQPWLASAYVPGPSLADAVRTHGALPTGTVLSLVAGIAEALQSITPRASYTAT
ncbi:protein kinase domain-containing protein [Streptomyces cavernicola]|uniref:protein kinase domain-containing protein n=1 Tax=Streptomyces cavernicola TaxID=3043613 RepID=UPI0038CFBAA6